MLAVGILAAGIVEYISANLIAETISRAPQNVIYSYSGIWIRNARVQRTRVQIVYTTEQISAFQSRSN
jgi:hypothetical protein